jgi:hypothetical protein
VEPFALHPDIESAHNHRRTVEDEAIYYAGLAFGIVLGSVLRNATATTAISG